MTSTIITGDCASRRRIAGYAPLMLGLTNEQNQKEKV